MVNWKLKSCPRCGGDVFVSRDEYDEWYETCLQCGYFSALKAVAAVRRIEPERAEAENETVEAG